MAPPSTLASRSRYLLQYTLSHLASCSALYQCKGRSLSYRDFLGNLPDYASASDASKTPRLKWHERMSSESSIHSSIRVRMQFSARRYAPCPRELLRGLWSLDRNPIWLLVDQLVATGKPHNMAETCPDFLKWQHAVNAPDFFTAIDSLLNQGYLPVLKLDTARNGGDNGEESEDTQSNLLPSWLSLYLICTKLDNPDAAHAGISFAISQIGKTPAPLRVPLLLFAMCSASDHRLTAYVPALLQAFQDVFTHESSKSINTLGAQETVIYQYHVLLTLLSRFPLVPQFATHVDRLLRYMHAIGVPLESATAAQLITPHKTVSFLVKTVERILEAQQVAPSAALSVSLTRYFSKGRNQREAAKHSDISSGVDSLAHAKTYILSFRDVAASLAYLRTVEAQYPPASESHSFPEDTSNDEPEQKHSLGSMLLSRQRGQVRQVRKFSITRDRNRHIYTSMLFAAALSKDISVGTFSSMVDAIHAAHGGDKVLHTVALVGLLRRRAWHEARDRWETWEKLNISLRRTVHETEVFFGRREETFGDAAAVRQELNMTEHHSRTLRSMASRMTVDSTALAAIVRAVAGPDNAGLIEAFEVMDGYAIKTTLNPDADQGSVSQDPQYARFRPHDVRLTSRVVNCFLMRVFAMRRPDIVFRFWDSMTPYYGVEVSVPTLELALRAARIATSMEDSLTSVIPRWFLSGTLRDTLPVDAFSDFGDEIRWMLSPKCRPGTRWKGLPAWRMARRMFRDDIIFANWPWLRDVAVPAQPVRGDAATSAFDALQELAMGDTQAGVIGPYPHLVPRARTFREYVLLLSRVQRASEIPQVLAWMRALEVRPSRTMLSLFLGLWAEVGLGSPADDVWMERDGIGGGDLQHGGEYGRLVAWLEEWLGKSEVPDDAEAISSLKYAREMEQNEKILQ